MLPDKKGAIFVIEDAKISEQTVELVKQLGAELKINTSVVDEVSPAAIASHIDHAINEAVVKIEKMRCGIVDKRAELAKITKSYDEQMTISIEMQEGLIRLRTEIAANKNTLVEKHKELLKAQGDNKQIGEKVSQLDSAINSLKAVVERNKDFIKAKRVGLAKLKAEFEELRAKLGKEKLINIDALDSKTVEVLQIKAEFENALLDEGREAAKQSLKGVLSMAPNRVVAQELLVAVMNYCLIRAEYFDQIPVIAKLESNLKSAEDDLENHINQKSTLEGMLREGHETVEVLEPEIAELTGILEVQEQELKKQNELSCKVEKAIGSTIRQKDQLVTSVSNEEINLRTEEAVLAKLSQSLLATQEEVRYRGKAAVELSAASSTYAEVHGLKIDQSKKSIQVVIVNNAKQVQEIKAVFEKDFYVEIVDLKSKAQAVTVDAMSVSKRFADQQPVNAGEKPQDAKPEVTKVTQLQRLLGCGLLLAERLTDAEKAGFGEKASQVLASLNKHLNYGYRLFMCKCPLLRNNDVPFYYLAPLGTTSMASDSIYNLKANAHGVTFKKMDDMVIFPGGDDNVSKMFDWKNSKDRWTRLIGNASSGFAIFA
jgi:hypothetical protein